MFSTLLLAFLARRDWIQEARARPFSWALYTAWIRASLANFGLKLNGRT